MKPPILCLLVSLLVTVIVPARAQLMVTVNPALQSPSTGGSAKFSAAVAKGTPPYTVQWWLTNGPICIPIDPSHNASATSWSLVITNVCQADQGGYLVVVTDATTASATSRVAQLTIDPSFTKINTGPLVTDKGTSFDASWGDYDNDGNIDLLVIRYLNGKNSLYRNNGDGTFTSITDVPFVQSTGYWNAGGWADYDNDGRLDLLIGPGTVAGAICFYHQNADGTFTPIPSNIECPWNAAWADYDRDGFLDLFLANSFGKANDALYHNNHDGTFRSMTYAEVGAIVRDGFAVASGGAWGDYDDDGWPDLFVGEHTSLNRLYHNVRGRFELVGPAHIIRTGSGLTGAWGDYDNDGRLDLAVAVYDSHCLLYRNEGGGAFTSITEGPVVTDTGANSVSWADYDNDGFLDLFFTSSLNRLYHNNGDGTFTRITTGSLVTDHPVPASALFYAGLWLDYDNDGFLDLYVLTGNDYGTVASSNLLYRNNGNSNGWLKLRLVGTASNRMGIGAKVRVKATYTGQERWQRRDISGASFNNGNQLYAHFGLGDATRVDEVKIEWPSGTVQSLTNVAPNQFLTVYELPALQGQLQSDGSFDLGIRAEPNRPWRIEGSADLRSWQEVATMTSPELAFRYAIADVASAPHRFYRLVEVR